MEISFQSNFRSIKHQSTKINVQKQIDQMPFPPNVQKPFPSICGDSFFFLDFLFRLVLEIHLNSATFTSMTKYDEGFILNENQPPGQVLNYLENWKKRNRDFLFGLNRSILPSTWLNRTSKENLLIFWICFEMFFFSICRKSCAKENIGLNILNFFLKFYTKAVTITFEFKFV